LILFLCLALALLPKLSIVEASGAIYIRADGSIEPPTAPIQPNGTTYTLTGNISEPIVVERSNIAVDGAGFFVTGSDTENGFNLTAVNNVTITNAKVSNWQFGFFLYTTSNSTITNNIMTENGDGIYMRLSSSNTVSRNNITNNLHYGIVTSYHSLNNTFKGNNIRANKDYGMRIWLYSNSNHVIDNNITDNRLYGLWLDASSNNTLSGNSIANNSEGIILYASANQNNIVANNITSNQYGIDLYAASNDKFRNNTLTNSIYSIYVHGGSLTNFKHDVDASNKHDGKPVCYWVDKVNLTVPADAGFVALVNCTGITAKNLSLSKNGQGILLAYTRDSRIVENNIANNEYGIYLYSSSNNAIYHNSVANNSKQAYVYDSTNTWNDTVEGNQWSDYAGIDFDQDGIGDNAYVIDTNNTDNHPLMGKYYTSTVVQNGTEYNIHVVSNSTVRDIALLQWLTTPNQYLQPGQTYIRLSLARETNTTGFCRIAIPRTLLNGSPYIVLVDWHEVPARELPESTSSEAYIYFTSQHSEHEAIIIPEFPSIPTLTVLLVLTTLTVLGLKLLEDRKKFS